jgi:hypothetical protein
VIVDDVLAEASSAALIASVATTSKHMLTNFLRRKRTTNDEAGDDDDTPAPFTEGDDDGDNGGGVRIALADAKLRACSFDRTDGSSAKWTSRHSSRASLASSPLVPPLSDTAAAVDLLCTLWPHKHVSGSKRACEVSDGGTNGMPTPRKAMETFSMSLSLPFKVLRSPRQNFTLDEWRLQQL